jgi:hypothetical protein
MNEHSKSSNSSKNPRYVTKSVAEAVEHVQKYLLQKGYPVDDLVHKVWDHVIPHNVIPTQIFADLFVLSDGKNNSISPDPVEIKVSDEFWMVNTTDHGVTIYFSDGIFENPDGGPSDTGRVFFDFKPAEIRMEKIRDTIGEVAAKEHQDKGYIEILVSGDDGTGSSPKGVITPPP